MNEFLHPTGAVVANFLYQAPLAGRVRGAILDAPGLSLSAAIEHGARGRKLPAVGAPVPPALTAAAKAIAGLRYDLDWDALDYAGRPARLPVPVLLFHGTADPRLPFATSQAWAAARPDLVTFVPVTGAGHVRSWNTDPARYEQAVRTFMDRITAARS
jgi:fermentation-respiration switch protein FrsA (DUF1100 family)